MEVRTYYANTIETAFALARREFGAEAMLMQSNLSAPALAQRGAYEVVFAGEPLPVPAVPSRALAPEPALWKTQGSSLAGIVRPAKVSKGEIAFGPVDLLPGRAIAAVTPGPVPVPVPKRMSTRSSSTGAGSETPVVLPFRNVVCNSGHARFASSTYTIALVGPTGSGKTTTAMKLAVRYGLLAARPCMLVAFDPDRVGTTERLRHFSNLIKIPFEAVETPAQLSEVMNRQSSGLTIIDTPACTRADDHVLAGLTFLLSPYSVNLDTQLVLRADRKLADNIAAARRFSALSPKRLIVTALDETTDYGELEPLVTAVGLPLSFIGTGQRIPDDLEAATAARLQGLLKHGWSRTASAAA